MKAGEAVVSGGLTGRLSATEVRAIRLLHGLERDLKAGNWSAVLVAAIQLAVLAFSVVNESSKL